MRERQASPPLEIRLLGNPTLTLNGQTVSGFRSAKTRALFYYLAVNEQAQSRSTLAGLFWGDVAENHARRSLTAALSNLRALLEPYLTIDRDAIAFAAEADCWLDVYAFESGLTAAMQAQDVAAVQTAVTLYQGDFLAGFYIADAPAFEQWLLIERARLRERAMQGLHWLAEQLSGQANLQPAIDTMRQAISLEPWREEAHRQLMLLLAQAGQRSAALAQYEHCCRILAEELDVEPDQQTVNLYDRIRAGEFRRAPAAAEADSVSSSPPTSPEIQPITPPKPAPGQTRLPRQTTAFIGREKELADILDRLTNPACRLLSLVGPGGIGKTRLAVEAAARCLQPDGSPALAEFADGIYFVPLAAISLDLDLVDSGQLLGAENLMGRSASAFISTIAQAVDFPFHGPSELVEQLLNYLCGRQMLLILDNYEHLLKCIDLVDLILHKAPGIKLLVTSRERVKLPAEWVFAVGGLGYPAAHTSVTDDQTYSAITFFMQRARQLSPGFEPSEAEWAAVAQICRLVEGVPLALELAVNWLPTLTCAEIVREIEQSLDFLAQPVRNVPARHRSLRAVFERSWQMLANAEQILLAKLSVFRGGCQPQAVKQVTGASLAMIASLIDKSLLRRSPTGRYELHELVRQYAAEKLWVDTATPEPSELARRIWQAHSSYYLRFVSQQESLLCGEAPQEAVNAIRTELDNIRQAWRWAVVEANYELIEAGLDGLSRFYDLTGLFAEGETIFDQTAAQVQAGIAAAEDGMTGKQALSCRLLIEQARMLHRQGLVQQAVQVAQKAAAQAQALESTGLEAAARHQWGDSLSYGGQVEAAEVQLKHALQLAQAAQRPVVEAEATRDLGIVYVRQDEYQRSKRWHQRALTRFEALGDRRGATLVLMNLATVNSMTADYETVQPTYERVLQNFREMGDRWGEVLVTINLGDHFYESGDYAAALATTQRGLQLSRQLQDRASIILAMENLGQILMTLGDYSAASSYSEQALTIAREVGERQAEGRILSQLGIISHAQGQSGAGLTFCDQALELAESIGARRNQALALACRGNILIDLGQSSAAAEAYRQAYTLRHQTNEMHRALAPLAGLASALLLLDEPGQALAHVEGVLTFLQAKGELGVWGLLPIYLICYQVLQANQNDQAADVLRRGYTCLQERAATIPDERLRRLFLTQVPANRAILAAVESGAARNEGDHDHR